jgi:putative transposase
VLAVVDQFSRECVALVADTSLSGARVARELDAAIAIRRRPRCIVSDNGTELTSMAILRGRRSVVSPGTTSRLANHSRMASAKASTASCGMNVSTRQCSPPCAMHGWCSASGGSTTIRSGPIPNSAAEHPPKSPTNMVWGMPQTMLQSIQPSSMKGQDSTAYRIQIREHVSSDHADNFALSLSYFRITLCCQIASNRAPLLE